ncbi:MAG TPA: hypothetical protein VGB28_02400, partial [Actinomycetota bacterium]
MTRAFVRRLLVLGIGMALMAIPVPPARAQSLALDPTSGDAGSGTTASGCGWLAGETVVVLWDHDLVLGSASP